MENVNIFTFFLIAFQVDRSVSGVRNVVSRINITEIPSAPTE